MKLEPSAVEINRIDKSPDVAETIRLLLDRLNFIVDSLGDRVGRPQCKKRKDPIKMSVHAPGHFDDRRQAAWVAQKYQLLKNLRALAG